MSYLCYLCLFVFSGVQHMLCYVFLVLYPMVPVSLDCLVPYGASFSGLSCTLRCQFLWIVLYPMVPVSLDCLVPYGASFSGLSCTLWCQFLWIVLYPMVPVSLDCLVLYGASFSGLSIFDCPFSIL